MSHLCVPSYSVSIGASVCLYRAHNLGPLVVVTLLSVMLDNTGFIKAGPKQSEFEPQPGKTVKFSDVQGVDEAKEVGTCRTSSANRLNLLPRSYKTSSNSLKTLLRSLALAGSFPKVCC